MAKRLTKAQQAEEREKQIQAALAWPDYPCPEPQTIEQMKAATAHLDYGDGEAVRAWTYNAYTGRVTHGCYNRIGHSSEGPKTSSQRMGGPWFDTEADAYRALRWAVSRKMAEQLAAIDATTPSPP